MSFISILLLITIVIMFMLIYRIASFIGDTKVGLWHAFVNGYIRGEKKYRNWISEFNIYYWSLLVLIALIITALGLLGSYSTNRIFSRPEIAIIVSPMLWLGLYKSHVYYQNKIKEFS